MSGLDNKLKEILIATQPEEIPVTIDEAVDQIHQAFAEAGYMTPDSYRIPPYYFTGQEWYERFEKEYSRLVMPVDWGRSITTYASNAIEAAKRASGLEEL